MFPLALCLLLLSVCVFAVFFKQHQSLALIDVQPYAAQPSKIFPMATSLCLILLTGVLYSQLGRFEDHHRGHVDHQVGYLLQKTINEDRLALDANQTNPEHYLNLAHSHAAGGQYDQAVLVMDQLLALTAAEPYWLGLKASFLYYRDGRVFGSEAQALTEQALALDHADITTRMFLANQAFLAARYQEAIGHWQVLLASNKSDVNRTAIGNAILKAEARLAATPDNPTHQ